MFTQPTLYLGIMNGQHKITISGVVFYVEESCRKLLMDQLDSLKNPKKSQLSNERIAEFLLEELKEDGKDVVCRQAVEHLIERTKHLRKPD